MPLQQKGKHLHLVSNQWKIHIYAIDNIQIECTPILLFASVLFERLPLGKRNELFHDLKSWLLP